MQANGGMPTLTCDLGAGVPYPQQCLGDLTDFIVNPKPGPASAYDELATQWTFFAGVLSDNKLNCTGTLPSIFSTQFPGGLQSPILVNPTSASPGLDYSLSGATGTADCTVFLGDANYPGGQNYTQTVKQFRIKVK